MLCPPNLLSDWVLRKETDTEMQLEFQRFRRDQLHAGKRVEAELGRGRCELWCGGLGSQCCSSWSISLNSQVDAALPKAGPLGGSSLLLRQDLSWRVAWKGSEPYPPECGSQLHHTLLGFLHYSHYKMRYFVCLLVYMTTAFFRRRRPCPSYSFLENGKRLEQNSHSVNIAK